MFATLIEKLIGQPIDVLDEALATAQRKRDEAELEIAAITAVVDNTQAFQDHGQRSVNAYLKEQLNCSGAEARKIKRRARLFNQHPEIGTELWASHIGTGQVDLLADAQQHRRAGDRFVEFAPMLTDHAEHLEYADFATAVQHFIVQADPDGSFDDQQFHQDQRTASVAVSDGAVNVHASGGDPLQAAEMKKIFDRAAQGEFDKDCATRRLLHGDEALAHPLPRSADQRKFDAVYEIFMQSVTAPSDGKRPEPLVNLVIDPTTGVETLALHGFLDLDDAADLSTVDPSTRRCATTTGTPVHPDVVMKAMIRGSIRRVMVDAHDVVINMGRTQRLFTGKAREAAQLLAVRCGHRGCDIPAEFCDVDHVDEWATDGGRTDQANALPLCGVHDRWKHRERLRGRRDRSGRIHLVKPDGTVIKPLGARDPVWAEPTDPPSQPLAPDMLTSTEITWAEWVADHPSFAHQPDPGWPITVYDFCRTA